MVSLKSSRLVGLVIVKIEARGNGTNCLQFERRKKKEKKTNILYNFFNFTCKIDRLLCF